MSNLGFYTKARFSLLGTSSTKPNCSFRIGKKIIPMKMTAINTVLNVLWFISEAVIDEGIVAACHEVERAEKQVRHVESG